MLEQTRVRTFVTTPPCPTHLPTIALPRIDERNMTEMTEKNRFQDLTRVIEVRDAMSVTDMVISKQNAQPYLKKKRKV